MNISTGIPGSTVLSSSFAIIGQGELIAWLSAVVSYLVDVRGIPLASLMRCQFVLARRLQQKLAAIYEAERSRVYQRSLFDAAALPKLSLERGFVFFDGMFAGVRTYRGRIVFPKHYLGKDQVPAFDGKGENGDDGEEIKCAVALDSLPEVKRWVRNVPKHENAFWLPLANGRFYPDFVAELKNDRTFVVEYKRQRGKNDPEEKEKLAIGRKFAQTSERGDVFCRVEIELDGMDMREQMQAAIGQI